MRIRVFVLSTIQKLNIASQLNLVFLFLDRLLKVDSWTRNGTKETLEVVEQFSTNGYETEIMIIFLANITGVDKNPYHIVS